MDATVQIRQRGTLTLPAELRERYGIRPGDTFRLVDLDGVFVLTPMVPMVPELAIALLACARIGAPHSVIFGGFSAARSFLEESVGAERSRTVMQRLQTAMIDQHLMIDPLWIAYEYQTRRDDFFFVQWSLVKTRSGTLTPTASFTGM